MKLKSNVQVSCDHEIAQEFYELADNSGVKTRGDFMELLLGIYKEQQVKIKEEKQIKNRKAS